MCVCYCLVIYYYCCCCLLNKIYHNKLGMAYTYHHRSQPATGARASDTKIWHWKPGTASLWRQAHQQDKKDFRIFYTASWDRDTLLQCLDYKRWHKYHALLFVMFCQTYSITYLGHTQIQFNSSGILPAYNIKKSLRKKSKSQNKTYLTSVWTYYITDNDYY